MHGILIRIFPSWRRSRNWRWLKDHWWDGSTLLIHTRSSNVSMISEPLRERLGCKSRSESAGRYTDGDWRTDSLVRRMRSQPDVTPRQVPSLSVIMPELRKDGRRWSSRLYGNGLWSGDSLYIPGQWLITTVVFISLSDFFRQPFQRALRKHFWLEEKQGATAQWWSP